MNWKVPAEHTVDNAILAAELQIFHVQYATNRQVALSILFDESLSWKESKLKTCFFESFDFSSASQSILQGKTLDLIDIPLKEFLNYLPQDKYIYYDGSETLPECSPSVTWIVNMSPFAITSDQVQELKSLLSPEVQASGNARNIQEQNGRTIYKFDNSKQTVAASALALETCLLATSMFLATLAI